MGCRGGGGAKVLSETTEIQKGSHGTTHKHGKSVKKNMRKSTQKYEKSDCVFDWVLNGVLEVLELDGDWK